MNQSMTTSSKSRPLFGAAFTVALALFPALAGADSGTGPRGVSPGQAHTATTLSNSCPTFSWSGIENAGGYDLILYRVAENGTLESSLQTQVPGGATSWSPAADQCPASDAQYAWAVRAKGAKGNGPWSEPLFFATAGMPSDDEVRQALAVLGRYRQGKRGNSPGEDVSANAHASQTQERPFQESPKTGPNEKSKKPVQILGVNRALTSSTVGEPSPQVVTTPSQFSLAIDGDFDLGGFVFKNGVPFLHNDGYGNLAIGDYSLIDNSTIGYFNTAVGIQALRYNTTGTGNTSVGGQALSLNTTGDSNTGVGARALHRNIDGTGNTGVGFYALYYNAGDSNTGVGSEALTSNTFGSQNTGVGKQALRHNTNGNYNTGVGKRALFSNTTGHYNTAVGDYALSSNITGFHNTAIGSSALFHNKGIQNTAVGLQAARNVTTGDLNTAVGLNAGLNWSTGDKNIALGFGAYGAVGESGTTRIGGSGNQTRAFIEGVHGVTVAGGTQVFIKSDGQLGTSTSSVRFKQEIENLGSSQREKLLDLRPVQFRFKDELASEGDNPIEYGLLAEEVAEVFPELVTYKEERPYSVRYHLLAPLLLAEMQRQEGELERQEDQIVDLKRQAANRDRDYRKTVAELRRKLEKLAKKKRYR